MYRHQSRILRLACALTAALLALSAGAAALGEGTAFPADTDLLLARTALTILGIRAPDGGEIQVRRETETVGRGEPAAGGAEPDYTGVLGYAALPPSEKINTFSQFTRIPWELPTYEKQGDKWVAAGRIPHRTPVVVVAQELSPGRNLRYRGRIRAVRLDRNELVWLSVAEFVTAPYWTMEPEEASRYGYCVAVYRNGSRNDPVDRASHRGPLPDGTRVLLCIRGDTRYESPDRIHNPLMGIVFHGREEEETGTFLFFNPDDLTIVY